MRSAPRELAIGQSRFAAGHSDQPLHVDMIREIKVLNRDHEIRVDAIRPLCIL
jgi:hypothetical protein